MTADTITFLHTLGKLKETERTGWVENGIPNPESVSDHMYRAAVMCMLCPDKSLERNKLIRMALCHDMGESIVGDISPKMSVSKEEKYRREKAAVSHLSGLLGNEVPLSGELLQLWEEYEAQSSPEARFLKDVDLLEMVTQAHAYELAHPEKDLSSFFLSGEKIQHPWARGIYETLLRTRPSVRQREKGEERPK
ncbi:hydrolase of HD superfamily [Trypanosoma conorhini]|uniref:5'-deoxynucleotidase n=1 Tax=Trypanosoma conorhini TaxID=83891 RepID=A0A422PTC4_9TRYP|nr:hydrolase of HD superfamily [Trypanosoma conorhini]RNF20747.1 hydrolase of HD superfamily [Trypanosoma conorhini]